jgi:hypothetical protein
LNRAKISLNFAGRRAVDDIRRDEQAAGDRPMSTADLAGAGENRAVDDAANPMVQDGEDGAAPLLPENEAGDLRRH